MLFDKIKKLCDEKGISISQLEREVGLANATIRRWVTCAPSVTNLKLVADHFGCTVDELLKEEAE